MQITPSNPTCIYLILTNAPQKFQSSCVLETGLLDFHLMTVTVLRKIFKKLKPGTKNYRSYKYFSNEAYSESLLHELSKEVFVNNDHGLQRFCDTNINILNRNARLKSKLVRGNQIPFITKDLSKAIMKRSRLHNNFLKNRTGKIKPIYKTKEQLRLTFENIKKEMFCKLK